MTGGAAPRRKGATWATLVANALRAVFPAITLTAPGQAHDHGDFANLPFLGEAKAHNAISLGEWSTQAEKAAITTHLYRWAIFAKRRGKPEVRDGYMVVPIWLGLELWSAWQAQRVHLLADDQPAEAVS